MMNSSSLRTSSRIDCNLKSYLHEHSRASAGGALTDYGVHYFKNFRIICHCRIHKYPFLFGYLKNTMSQREFTDKTLALSTSPRLSHKTPSFVHFYLFCVMLDKINDAISRGIAFN